MTEQIESILAIDHGNVTTKVALLERVEGSFRFVTQGEVLTEADDLQSRVLRALESIQARAGRRILEDGRIARSSRSDRQGVDAVVMTTTARRPLRMLLAGIVSDSSASPLRRVMDSLPVEVVGTLGIDDLRRHGGAKGAAAMLRQLSVEAVFFAGGRDNGPLEPLVQVAASIAAAQQNDGNARKLPLIYSGGKMALSSLSEVLANRVEMAVIPNLESEDGLAKLQPACDALYRLYADRNPALQALREALIPDGSPRPMAGAQGTSIMASFLARRDGHDALVVELGSESVGGFSVIDGYLQASIKSGIGCGRGATAALTKIGLPEVLTWLDPTVSEDTVVDLMMNKALRPHTVPQTAEEIQIEMALTRQLLARSAPHGEAFRSVVVSGGVISRLQNPGLAALVILDGLQPTLPLRMYVDDLSLLSRLGALATVYPDAAGQVLDADILQPLGTAISVGGKGKEGEVAVVAKIQYAGGQVEVQVPFGSLEVIPLSRGEQAQVTLSPTRRFQIGSAAAGKRQTIEVEGGAAGLIIDARGRPLELPLSPDKRGKKLEEWNHAVGMAQVG